MRSLFASEEQGGTRETPNILPEEIRQLIVDLHFELPSMSWREIAEVCYIRYGRRPHHKHVKRIATSGSLPSLQARRYQTWHTIPDPAERKLAVIRLHSDGWSITSIAEYLGLCRHFRTNLSENALESVVMPQQPPGIRCHPHPEARSEEMGLPGHQWQLKLFPHLARL